jgi:hypothetical protein
MSVVSGPVTFGSTGSKTVILGIAASEILFLPDNSHTIGHADHAYQFSRTGSLYDHTKISIYDTSNVKRVEFTVTGWGASTFTCNVTLADNSISIPLIART